LVERDKWEPHIEENVINLAEAGDRSIGLATGRKDEPTFAHRCDLLTFEPVGISEFFNLIAGQVDHVVLADVDWLILQRFGLNPIPHFEFVCISQSFGV